MAVAPFFGPLYFFTLFPLSFPLAILGVALTVLGLLTAGASDRRRQKETAEKDTLWRNRVSDLEEALQNSLDAYEDANARHAERELFWNNYLFESTRTTIEDLNWITADLVRAAGLKSHTELVASRKIILEMMRHYLGPVNGVRTNVFELDESGTIMKANPSLTFGREDHCSQRTFTPSDRTFRMVVRGLTRFESDMNQIADEEEKECTYGTFITAPIGTGTQLYGMVAIDAPKAGDLTEADRALFIHLAQLLSLTYALDEEQPQWQLKESKIYSQESEEKNDA